MKIRFMAALLLIIACMGALHFISNSYAGKLRGESAALDAAARRLEQSGQLAESVNRFRLATYAYRAAMPGADTARAANEVADSALRIGTRVNALRMNGMPLYDLHASIGALDDVNLLVGDIIEAKRRTSAPPASLAERENALTAVTAEITARASLQRAESQARLNRLSREWQATVLSTGLLAIVLLGAIVFDFTRNVIPALGKMHSELRRLAAGELEIELESFRLVELKALSGALETFRRNALAVRNQALTDPSTGLPNRRAFMERASERLARARAEHGGEFAVMLVDIDRFKLVNDDYGHAMGDLVVKRTAERLAAHLGPETIIARVGGDEFAICVPVTDQRHAGATASGLVAAMQTPIELDHLTLSISISVGHANSLASGCFDVNRLLNEADLALYAAKREGRNLAMAFTAQLETERRNNEGLERDLKVALAENQLRLVYQPILPLLGKEQEVEALARWRHPERGEVPPGCFIPVAERSGLMVPLGNWILETALTDLARWPGLSMSVNLSPIQLQHNGFVGFLLDLCRTKRIAPSRVILEVTESLSIERNTRALTTLNLLRASGFRIALDDFGTGYSSLCMMKTFKFDRLKLDRSLVSDLGTNVTTRAVFDAAVTMGLRLGAEVVAEGLSEEGLVEPVFGSGCTHVQGYHFSMPIEADEVPGYYAQGHEARRKVA